MKNLISDIVHQIDLLIVVLSSLIGAVAALTFPDGNTSRVILGLPLLLICPGYAMVSMLWPEVQETGKGIGNLERVVLSIGLSIAMLALIGLLLSFTAGFTQFNVVMGNLLLIIVFSGLAYYRRKVSLPDKMFFIDISQILPSFSGTGEKLLTTTLAIAIIMSAGVAAYLLLSPGDTEGYSSFYLLSADGSVVNQSFNTSVAQQMTFRIGVSCHEHLSTNYTILVGLDNSSTVITYDDWPTVYGLDNNSVLGRNLTLGDDTLFEENFSFYIDTPGKYLVVWQLLIDGQETNYRLQLHVDVE